MIGLVPVMMLSRNEALVSKQWIGVSSSSTLTKTQQMTKHVDGTVFPYLDAGSNPASSTNLKVFLNTYKKVKGRLFILILDKGKYE